MDTQFGLQNLKEKEKAMGTYILFPFPFSFNNSAKLTMLEHPLQGFQNDKIHRN